MALHLAFLIEVATWSDQLLLNDELAVLIGGQLVTRRQHDRSNCGEKEIGVPSLLLKIALVEEGVFVAATVAVDSCREATAVAVFEQGHGSVVHCVVA